MPLPPPPTILHCTADRRFIGSPFSGCNVTVRSYLPSDHNLCAQSKKLILCTCHRQITKQRNDTVVKTALPFLKCEFQLTCMYTCKFTVTFKKRQGIPHDVVGEGMTRERATDLNKPHSLFLLTQRLGIKDDTHFPEFCVEKQMSAQRVHSYKKTELLN